MQPRRWSAATAGWLSAGVLATAAGGGVISVGTGAMGLETETFTLLTMFGAAALAYGGHRVRRPHGA
ncbi:hypothetical protein [Actinomadura sp. 6K520]|uniref:hypothetical protein n=1 Tax=Actinomadura sp. 6K520 TaxID=2530364 RepID=UPI00104CD163|nr:hypothetical protein [Actinomadura sp. 6K520]TDE32425.1 hypothetical protein E1289_15605 [Actinomadura sp. 6K520]